MSESIADKEYRKFIDMGDGLRGVAIINYGLAVDGPNAGQYVPVGVKYNTTGGYYELLTAGSGTTTTTDITNTVLLQDGGNFLLQDGGELLLQA